ncbi:hypothetical protein P5704_027695 (plasmid) [Pseudomonas sp. FeN3W]|nr:hypothetical protein P5704_027695 [Pseudomonas sp. FeN3W]
MILTHKNLRHPSSLQHLAIRTSEGTSLEITLAVVVSHANATVIISGDGVFSRVTLPAEKALRLKPEDLGSLNFYSAGTKEVDPEASVIEMARLIHEMFKNGEIQHDQYVEHMEMISLHQPSQDIDALVTYMHFSDLASVAQDCIVMAQDGKELLTWKLVWPKAVRVVADLSNSSKTAH